MPLSRSRSFAIFISSVPRNRRRLIFRAVFVSSFSLPCGFWSSCSHRHHSSPPHRRHRLSRPRPSSRPAGSGAGRCHPLVVVRSLSVSKQAASCFSVSSVVSSSSRQRRCKPRGGGVLSLACRGSIRASCGSYRLYGGRGGAFAVSDRCRMSWRFPCRRRLSVLCADLPARRSSHPMGQDDWGRI